MVIKHCQRRSQLIYLYHNLDGYEMCFTNGVILRIMVAFWSMSHGVAKINRKPARVYLIQFTWT